MSSANSSYYKGWAERPYNPDPLFKRAGGYELFDEMLEDDQIAPLSLLKKYLILNPEFVVESEDDKVKDFFKDVIMKECDQPFKAYALEQLSHFDYGNSLSEPLFEVRDIPGWGQKVVLRTVKTRAPHSIEYHTHDNGDVKEIIQNTDTKRLVLPPDKFLHLVNNPKFSNPYGKSDLTVGVYRAWWSKKILIRFLNIYLERFGAPALAAFYSKATSPSVITELKRIIGTLSEQSGVMLPDDVQIREMTPRPTGTNPFIESITMYNLMIARALLIPDLAGYGGSETAGGSYALGEEQFKTWYATLELPTDMYLWQLNQKIIRPLVRWNFGDEQARVTGAVLRGENGKEQRENSRLYLDAVATGNIKATLDAVNTFLRSIGYPEIPEADWEEKPAISPQNPPPQQQPPEGPPPGEGEKPEPETPEKGDVDPRAPESPEGKKEVAENTATGRIAVFSASRELTEYEKRVDFAGMNSGLDDLEERYGEILHEKQKAIVTKLVSYIRRKRIVEDKRLDLVNSLALPKRELGEYKKAALSMLLESYLSGHETAQADIQARERAFKTGDDISIDELLDVIASINIDDDTARTEAIFAALRITKATKEMVDWIDAAYGYLVTGEAAALLSLSQTTLIEGVRSGLTQQEMVKTIQTKVGDTATRARIVNIVRSNVARAFSNARLHEYQSIGKGEITGYQISAIMDSRTSPICRRLDKKIIPPDEAGRMNPPFHHQCRTILIPIFKEEPAPEFSELPGMDHEPGGFLKLKEED